MIVCCSRYGGGCCEGYYGFYVVGYVFPVRLGILWSVLFKGGVFCDWFYKCVVEVVGYGFPSLGWENLGWFGRFLCDVLWVGLGFPV